MNIIMLASMGTGLPLVGGASAALNAGKVGAVTTGFMIEYTGEMTGEWYLTNATKNEKIVSGAILCPARDVSRRREPTSNILYPRRGLGCTSGTCGNAIPADSAHSVPVNGLRGEQELAVPGGLKLALLQGLFKPIR